MNRHEQREQAFLFIFERTFQDESLEEIIENAQLSRDLEICEFSKKAFIGVKENQGIIDNFIEQKSVGWRKERLSRVVLAALRLAIYEMLYEKEIPSSVSINEAVDIVKKYSTREDSAFANGILSSVHKEMEATNV